MHVWAGTLGHLKSKGHSMMVPCLWSLLDSGSIRHLDAELAMTRASRDILCLGLSTTFCLDMAMTHENCFVISKSQCNL